MGSAFITVGHFGPTNGPFGPSFVRFLATKYFLEENTLAKKNEIFFLLKRNIWQKNVWQKKNSGEEKLLAKIFLAGGRWQVVGRVWQVVVTRWQVTIGPSVQRALTLYLCSTHS